MRTYQLCKNLITKSGRVGFITAVLVIAGISQTYASTDGFCHSSPIVSKEKVNVLNSATISESKTSTLDVGKTQTQIEGSNGTNEVTYSITKHCGRQKSKTVVSTKVLVPVVNGSELVGTRHDITETASVLFATVRQDNPSAFEGDDKVSSPGVMGSQVLTYSVAQDEGQAETKVLTKTVVVSPPTDQIVLVGTKKHEYVSIRTYPVAYPGSYATLTAVSLPGSVCSISVRYSSGYSTAAGLYSKSASGDGSLAWTWKVGTRTYAGDWPIIVSCTLNGDQASATSHIIVN